MKSKERSELLNKSEERGEGIGVAELFIVFFFLLIALAIFIPKIYLANEIYYTSRKINKLLEEYEILKEENRILRQRIEEQKFKAQVLDTIY
jgi:cell division protein FtsL